MVDRVLWFLYMSVFSALRSDWLVIVDAVCPILRCIWLFSSDLGGAAGGAHEATSISFMVERVLGFLYMSMFSALRSDWDAIVDAVCPISCPCFATTKKCLFIRASST